MSISKADLRINNSDYFREILMSKVPKYHVITELDVADPGRIALTYGFTHDLWKIILKYNHVVDPIDELSAGEILQIPDNEELKSLKTV